MTRADTDPARSAAQLRRIVLVLARRLRPGLKRDGIGTAKLSLVGRLYRAGAMTPTELAAAEGVKVPSLTRPLAELAADGWLVREADAADGRRCLLRLTALGRKRLVAAAHARDARLAGAIAATLDADEQKCLMRAGALLERVGDALDAPAEQIIPRRGP